MNTSTVLTFLQALTLCWIGPVEFAAVGIQSLWRFCHFTVQSMMRFELFKADGKGRTLSHLVANAHISVQSP